jgi:hypothetical protein
MGSIARRLAILASLPAVAAAPAAAAPPAVAAAPPALDVRTADPADDGAHPSTEPPYTEWWYANVIDPRSGLALAFTLSAAAPGATAGVVMFAYLPGGETFASFDLSLGGAQTAGDHADVRIGDSSLVQTDPRRWSAHLRTRGMIAAVGDPRDVEADLSWDASTDGFTAGPLAVNDADQEMSWTVAVPTARVSGDVRIGDDRFHLGGALGYHDHNWGRFDLNDADGGGWDWAQFHLPAGEALAVGVVKAGGRSGRSGSAGGLVWQRPDGRAVARQPQLTVRYGGWFRAAGIWVPGVERIRGTAGRHRIEAVYRARRPLPLARSRAPVAIMEIVGAASGTIRDAGSGRVVRRFSAAPGFYEYMSTPAGRGRDGSPGPVLGAATDLRDALQALLSGIM